MTQRLTETVRVWPEMLVNTSHTEASVHGLMSILVTFLFYDKIP